jgi:serine protease Do
MKREAKQHLVYGLIIALVVTGIVLWQNQITIETRNTLGIQINQLNQQLKELQLQLDNNIAELQQQDSALKGDISSLNTTLSEKETAIQSLSGELRQLRVDNEQQVAVLEDTISNLKLQNQDFSDIIDEVVKAVVSVRTNVGRGSGFITEREGYIVTNYHVIKGASAASVFTYDGNTHAVRLVGFDQNADIAVIKIDVSGLDRLRFTNSDNVRVGEKVIAVGNPGGLDFTVTQGIISAVRRSDSKGNQYIQIDAPINPGNSGGPLINAEGRVIGVNTLKAFNLESVGFALEGNQVKDIVNQLIGQDSG